MREVYYFFSCWKIVGFLLLCITRMRLCMLQLKFVKALLIKPGNYSVLVSALEKKKMEI